MNREQEMALLEQQITDGEKWLAENKGKPSYERGLERYYQRIEQWCRLDLRLDEEEIGLLSPEETAALLESRASIQSAML